MILTAREISQQLAARADSYARWLLPRGRMESGNWRVGSVDGEEGSSLGVQITGANAGIWADFAGDDRGDLLTLTSKVRKVTLGEAIKIAKDWLGIRDPESHTPKKSYTKPKPKGVKALTNASPVFNYLTDERKIDFFTQAAFKVSESMGAEGPEMVLPYIGPDGEVVNTKRIALKRTAHGKKICRQEPGCAPSLFGWHTLPDDCREVVITEGEIDAMTWYQMGFPALSIPDGAKGDTWIEYEWDNLQRFDTIWLNWDNDDEGQRSVRNFARRLGLHRCLVVTVGDHKDANEALQACLNEEAFAWAISHAKPLTPDQIKAPEVYQAKVIERFYPPDGRLPGFYPLSLEERLGMRPGEVTVWTGIAGHGKSAILNQLMLEALHFNFKVAIASMEMLGEQTLHRMICQSEQANKPTPNQIAEILGWMTSRLWIYDLLGNTAPQLILDLMEYSAARHGVDVFVIDSLMKCSVGSDDYDAQRSFLNMLASFSKDFGVHVNLVAHARKGKDESDRPGKLDVLGSSSIINQADNILSVWRNKDKEEKAFRNPKDIDPMEPDTTVFCSKQRETGDEFVVHYKFFKGIFRFRPVGAERLDDLSILHKLHPPDPALIPETQTQEADDPY